MKAALTTLMFAAWLLAACGSPAASPAAAPTPPPATAAAQAPATAAKPAETKPAESRPAEAKPAEAKPAAPEAARLTDPPSASTANPGDDLAKVFQGWGAVKSFRARMTTTGLPGSATDEMNMEIVMPDRFHATSSRMEMLKVGGDLWIKLPTGWQKFAQDLDMDFANPKKFQDELGASRQEVKLVGADVVDGTPCTVYQYTTTFTAPASAGAPGKPGEKPSAVTSGPYTSKIWVGVADRLPRKLETAGESGGPKTTVIYYDFNAPIAVNPPA